MLNRRVSLQSRDEAILWSLVAKRLRVHKDIVPLIRKRIFPGFEYLNGSFTCVHHWWHHYDRPLNIEVTDGSVTDFVIGSAKFEHLSTSDIYEMVLRLGGFVQGFAYMFAFHEYIMCNDWVASDEEVAALREAISNIPFGREVILWLDLTNKERRIPCMTYGDVLDALPVLPKTRIMTFRTIYIDETFFIKVKWGL